MRTMRAVVHREYGGPEKLRVEDVTVPEPAAGEVRVAVRAAGLNAIDWRTLRADPFFLRFAGGGVFRPKFGILGADVAGVVDAVGDGVTRFAVGDPVFGEITRGAFAEFVVGQASLLVVKPEGVSYADAAALPVAGLTALQGLRDVAAVTEGTRVLINGASGGVGTYAVQIARSRGARVTAVCSGSKADLVRSLGADEVIDYTVEDFVTREESWDVVFDLALARPGRQVLGALAPGGKHVVVGGDGHRLLSAMLRKAFGAPVEVVMAEPKADDLEVLGQMVASGALRPVIERRLPLEEGPEAIRMLDAGEVRGKLVLEVANLYGTV